MMNSTLCEFNNPINSLKSALSFIIGRLVLAYQFKENVKTLPWPQ